MIKLSRNQKIGIYSAVGAVTYIVYDKFKLNDISNRFQNQIDGINDKYYNNFPKIPQIYESIEEGKNDWKSENFYLGEKRTLNSGERDEFDEKGYFQIRGNGNYSIDPATGILTMGGSPRVYINSNRHDSKVREIDMRFNYKNTELTAYFKKFDTGAPYGGFIMGSRSHANGHSIKADSEEEKESLPLRELIDNYKFGNSYYGKIRYDGNISFFKETTHYWKGQNALTGREPPRSSEILKGQYILPRHFIGMKFIVYNIPLIEGETERDQKVKLELWLDTDSKGERHYVNGAKTNWKKIAEHIDGYGFWPTHINPDLLTEEEYSNYVKNIGKPADPLLDRNRALTESYGVSFIRNSGSEKSEYKYIELREIDPTKIEQPISQEPSQVRNITYQEISDNTIQLFWKKPRHGNVSDIESDINIKDYKITSGTATPRIETELTRKIGGLVIGRTYVFLIQARNIKSNKYGHPKSIIITKGKLVSETGTPSKPRNLRITKIGDVNVRITWDSPRYSNNTEQTNNDNIINYRIWSGKERIIDNNFIEIGGLTDPNRVYFFDISAKNDKVDAFGKINRIEIKFSDISNSNKDVLSGEQTILDTFLN